MKRTLFVCLCLLLPAAAACGFDEPREDGAGTSTQSASPLAASSETALEYDFEQPDLRIELHDDLEEISGLTLLSDGGLGAVQDEVGTIFTLDQTSGDIVERRSFGEPGDYEGIEQVGDQVFVLRSDGTLIEISGSEGDAAERRVIETSLSERNDTEGLAYDGSRNRLLIACKERPGSGLKKRHKAVYAYSISDGALLQDPVYTIDTEEIERRSGEKSEFKPSALAVHPADGDLYVLSSTTRMIAVLDATGGLQEILRLPEDLFEQPEGLAFTRTGTLYIASEGGGEGPGMLYAFSAGAGGR